MADAASFTKMVPGFDFLQGLVKNAGAALPNMGQWIAPTLNPEELEKRIEELRTVQFWLEQNARMLGATIQALEVQRMTLSTLKTMNVQIGELRDSIRLAVPGTEAAAPPEAPAARPAARKPAARKTSAAPKARVETPMGTVDPMQWWGALTKQFTTLAASAMKDSATDAAKNRAGAMVKQSFDAAGETLKRAVELGTQVPAKATQAAAKAVGDGVKVASRAAGAASAAAGADARRAAPRKRG